MNDIEFLAWFEAKVNNSQNTKKQRVKMKHITRIRMITAGPGSTYSPAQHGGAIKVATIRGWIEGAKVSITNQVVRKISA